jgi:site-specific recombinase XerD
MIQLSIVFNGRSKKLNKEGKGPIQIRAYENKQKKLFPTGLYVEPKQWDKPNQRVIKHEQAQIYNAEARRKLKELEDFILKSTYLNRPPTLEQCANFVKRGNNRSFTKFLEQEMQLRTDLTPNTKKKDKTALRHFKAFRKNVRFDQVNLDLIRKFKHYLLSKGLSVNSANSYHKRIKVYINIAIEVSDGQLIEKNPYNKIKLKDTPVQRFALTLLQVEQLEQLVFEQEEWHLEMKRDMFLICCYLGFRYSDMIKIKRNNFIKDHKGWCYLLKAQKTQKSLSIPLYLLFDGKPERILYKYFEYTSINKQQLFYPYRDQVLNRDLKKIAQRAGIEQHDLVSTKIGRITFATYLAKHIPLHVLQQLLQHSDIKTTLDYVQLENKDITEALERLEW